MAKKRKRVLSVSIPVYLVDRLKEVAEYIIDCESGEYDSYMSYCQENNLNPKNITKKKQLNHVYAKALVGLDLEFPEE